MIEQSLNSIKAMAQTSTCLCLDLQKIGLFPINPIEGKPEVSLILRPYSKTYYGQFHSKNNKIVLYYYKCKTGNTPHTPYRYSKLLLTAIHEAIHAKQRNDPNFVRHKGIMHDSEFYRLYNEYVKRAKELNLIYKEDS